MIGNGNWRSPQLHHHCVKGKCKLGCNGSRARARATMKRALKITCGPKMAVALLYRWKGFQQPNSEMIRARRQHRMWDRILRKVYPPKVVERALEQERLAAQRGQQFDDVSAKQSIRVGAVVRFINGDEGAVKNEMGAALSQPVQRFLDASFKADKATNKFPCFSAAVATAGSVSAASAAKTRQRIRELRTEAIAENHSIISGRRGK